MKFGAITIDTSIFVNRGRDFNDPLMNKLNQFKNNSPIEFVLSDVVAKEMTQQLIYEKYQPMIEKYASAISKLKSCNLIPSDIYDSLCKLEQESLIPTNIATKEFKNFLAKTGCKIVSSDEVRVVEILKQYFSQKPPFGKGKKKSEFPDAIALAGLENWAIKKSKNILVVSNDDDWANYANTSKNLMVVASLDDALNILNRKNPALDENISNLLSNLTSESSEELYNKILLSINEKITDYYFTVRASSHLDFEALTHEVQAKNFKFSDCLNHKIIAIYKDELAIQVDIEVEVFALAEFRFYSHDSIDGDFVHIGDSSSTVLTNQNARIILKLGGDIENNISDTKIVNVELSDIDEDIDFGYVEPEYDH